MKNNTQNWIEIIFWGVRGSIATPGKNNIGFGGNTSCVQVTSSFFDDLLVFDCGSGIVNLGNYLIKKETPITGQIFVTHTHWDHVQGIPFFKPFYRPKNQLSLHMYPQVGKSCQEIVKMVMAPVFFPVNIDAFQAEVNYVTEDGESAIYSACCEVEAMRTSHPGNTVMYKATIGEKVIVYCPDNEFLLASEERQNEMRAFIQNADVLIHDSQETRESYPAKVGWGHTAWEDAVELAIGCNVKNLFLTHHDPESSDLVLEERSKLLEPYQKHFNKLQFAREQDSFRILVD
jgi:phosphoribosyl 1,2-cyclic phosphodiesterase